MKKWAFCAILTCCLLLVLAPKTFAASYNADAAVNYAASHWNDEVGVCDQFVKACLSAGGVNISSGGVGAVYTELKGYGTSYVLTKSGSYVLESQNSGKIAKGDPVFFYCNSCGSFVHTAICGGINGSGQACLYGHNAAWNYLANFTGYYHYADEAKTIKHTNNTIYVIHMTGTTSTDTEAPTITNLCVINTNGAYYFTCDLNDNVGVIQIWLYVFDVNDKRTDIVEEFSAATCRNYAYEINLSEFSGPGYYSFHIYASDGTYTTKETLVNQYISPNRLLDIPNGTYTIVSALEGYALDVVGGNMNPGANVQIYQNVYAAPQKFTITKNGNYYMITSLHSGLALDVYNGIAANGANVVQWDADGLNKQKWTFEDAGNGYVYIKSALGYYLDVANGVAQNGANIWTYSFNGTTAQKFRLVAVSTGSKLDVVEGITYTIVSALEGYAIDVVGGNINPGANVQIYQNNFADSQKYTFTKNGDYYTITAFHSGLALDVYSDIIDNGANVVQWTVDGSNGEKWILEDAGNGWVYIHSSLGNYLDVTNGEARNGANVWAYSFNGALAQQFKLIPVAASKSLEVPEGTYTIASALNGKVIDVVGANPNPGANVQLYRNANADSQIFKIEKAERGCYTITALHSGMALDLAESGITYGVNVYQWPLSGQETQKWRFEDAGDGYVYIHSSIGYYMDVRNADMSDGANIWTYLYGVGADAQRFKLIPVSTNGTMNSTDGAEISWACDNQSNTITITGEVSAAEPVLVASYDEKGRMVRIEIVTVSGGSAAISSQAGRVKIFWVNSGLAPKCRNVDIAV